MCGTHSILLIESFIGLLTECTVRHGSCKVIVDLIMSVSVYCRDEHYDENHCKYLIMICYPACNPGNIRHENLVLCLLDCLITCKNQCREDCYTSDNSEYNALCHYDSQVKSKCKAHEAEGYEACDCCD